VPVCNGIPEGNLVREHYGTAFTSGTSGTAKKISLFFPQAAAGSNKKGLRTQLKRLKMLYSYKTGFWSRKDNRLIIFMPFSHLQQRTFVLFALMRKINIILSNPMDCIRHIVIEKPNIMISVPVFYEVLAKRIEEKLKQLSSFDRYILSAFNFLGIHRFSNRNLLKKIWTRMLPRDIRKIYGGRADYFITGSAAVRKDVLETFYRIGVKVFEAYGQSETTIIAMNTEKHFKIGSVGKPGPNIRLSADAEILVKYDEAKHGYNKNILLIKDGYIHTGDAGYVDKDGFLFLQGRIDDVIVLGNGKKVFPNNIEQKLTRYEPIKQAVIFCNRQNKLSLIIEPTQKHGNVSLPDIIREVNASLPAYERITEYFECKEPFTTENGLLTSSFKVKRKQVISKYASQTFIAVS
jgi:long-subunit acyl-CoA synthetase (AMP-forming)